MKPKARVLVVDDDPVVRSSCERVLGQEYDVRLAETGREGLDCLEAESFDLALVDLKLPDIGGMDILQQAPDRFPSVPIIIITGYSTVKNAVEAIKTGAFDYVAKPFTPDELEAAVEKLSPKHRPVFLMARYEGMPYEEIASTLGIPVGTVKSRMNKAVQFLLSELQETTK